MATKNIYSSYAIGFTLINALLFLNLATLESRVSGQELNKKDTGSNDKRDNRIPGDLVKNGWISLFDGHSLYGWRAESKANWAVKENAITVSEGARGLLRTSNQFDDYLLRVDFRSQKGTNSGVFLRTSPAGDNPKANCYEVNIADEGTNLFPTGSLAFRKKTDFVSISSEWQAYQIQCLGNKISIDLDGKRVLEFTDPKPLKRGFIGLQHNSGKVEFKNIYLKPLRIQPIFNGKDLTGWNEYPKMESKFSVKSGVLNVLNGSGQLETKSQFANFILQLDYRTNKAKLNSGIFFRCIPSEKMNGYESQIHNGFVDGDRTKPEDCGTGGIFRRQNARLVNGNDLEWNYKTIIAEGPHFSVWHNGIQVSDWTDKRKPNKNPRRGYRKEAGTIMIQGHDPTTDVDFKNLGARELSPRK